MSSDQAPSVISLEYRGRYAIVTIDNAKKLNALKHLQYYELASKLEEIETHDEVFVTVLLAKGRFFSAGADVTANRAVPEGTDLQRFWLQSFVAFNLKITDVFSKHSKILVVGLNGPVVGLSAALIAFADFIYCTPHTFVLAPFSSLGLVAEGGASRVLAQRLGPARSAEALIMSRRIHAEQLEQCGFVNAIFDEGGDDAKFRARVMHEVEDRLGEHLIGDSMTIIKKLIRAPERELLDNQNVKELFAGLDRFARGIPQEEFRKIASGEKRHKL